MSEARHYRIRLNDKDIDVTSLYEAAINWESDPDHVEVFETTLDPMSKDGSRTPIKKFEPNELKDVLKATRL